MRIAKESRCASALEQNLYTFRKLSLSSFKLTLASWLSEKTSCTKILLTFRIQPVAIALNYSVKNIWNDIRQIIIIYIYIYEKSQFNSLVWGSLTLAPTKIEDTY